MDLRMTWEGREKKETQAPPFICPLLPLITVFHQTILHLNMTVVFLGVSALFCPSFPPFLLLSSTGLASSLTHSLPSLYLMYYWRTQQAEWRRKKEREGGGERIHVTRGTQGARPSEQSYGGKCTMYRKVNVCRETEPEFAILSTPGTPKLVHNTFFESPTFVNWYWHTWLTHSFCHNCYHHCYLLTQGHVRLRLWTFLLYARVCICDPEHCSQ